jgi:hypothetical protein
MLLEYENFVCIEISYLLHCIITKKLGLVMPWFANQKDKSQTERI